MMAKQLIPTELDVLKDISGKLDDLIALVGVQGKDKEEQIMILVEKGYTNSEMAELLGIPKGTIDTIRANAKKR